MRYVRLVLKDNEGTEVHYLPKADLPSFAAKVPRWGIEILGVRDVRMPGEKKEPKNGDD